MQQLGNVQQNNQAAFELTHSGDIAGFTVGEDGTGRFNFGGWNFQDFRSGVDDQSDQFAIQFNNQNTVFLIVLNVGLAKTLAQVHHGNNFPAKIDDPFDGIGSVGNRGDFRHAHDFANGADAHPEGFIADAKTNDLKVLFDHAISGHLGTRHFRIFEFARILLVGLAAVGGKIAFFGLRSAIENEAVHAVEQV